MASLPYNKAAETIQVLNSTSGYLDNLINIGNS